MFYELYKKNGVGSAITCSEGTSYKPVPDIRNATFARCGGRVVTDFRAIPPRQLCSRGPPWQSGTDEMNVP